MNILILVNGSTVAAYSNVIKVFAEKCDDGQWEVYGSTITEDFFQLIYDSEPTITVA